MRKRTLWRYTQVLLVMAVFAGVPVYATSSSQNYQIVEQEFGSGSSAESCSGSYCARATIGDLAVGNAVAGESTAEFGSITPNEPSLEVIIDSGVSHLGELTTEQTAYKTMTVKVRTYLSNGYFLQISGAPPKYGNHALATPSTPTAATPGTEQFAINVVKNSTPNTGDNPVRVPSGESQIADIEPGYNTPNLFKYVDGDVVARSESGSGRTDYTVSMIVNISKTTPAGHYSGDFSAIVVPEF